VEIFDDLAAEYDNPMGQGRQVTRRWPVTLCLMNAAPNTTPDHRGVSAEFP